MTSPLFYGSHGSSTFGTDQAASYVREVVDKPYIQETKKKSGFLVWNIHGMV